MSLISISEIHRTPHSGPATCRASEYRMNNRVHYGRSGVGRLIPLVICTLLFYGVSHSFLSYNSVASMLRAMAFVGIIAVGQTWLMMAGEIDLSVGSVAGLCAVASAWLMKHAGWPVEAGLAAGILAGCLAGLINGIVAVRFGIPAFIATLGML